MKKIKFYLKQPHRQATVVHGEHAKTYKRAAEPFTCTEDEWEKILKPTGVFSLKRGSGTKDRGSEDQPPATDPGPPANRKGVKQ